MNLYEYIQQSRNNASCSYPIQENNGPIKYRTNNCAMPEGCAEQYEDEVEFNKDLAPGMVHDLFLSKVKIKAGFIPDKMPYIKTDENNVKWLIKESELLSKITISGLEEVKHHREFFPIQTSKRFLELSYDRAIVREDFHENILNDRVAVLDTVDGIGLPYSKESCYFKLLAGEKPPHEKILTWSDCPNSKLLLETNWGCLRNVIRYQRFYVHLVRGDCYNGEWTYIVLHTFHWFIYWDLYNNIYQCGINQFDAVLDLSKININRTCNKDQFMHYIDLETNQFYILNCPDYTYEKQIFDEIFTKLHSNEDCYKLPSAKIPHIEIKLEFFDWLNKSILEKSIFFIKLSLESNLLFVQNLETYQQFCCFILLGYWNNINWKYVVLYTTDKQIYLNFFHRFFGYKCGHSQRTLQNSLKINILQTRNINQFNIWIEFGKNQFIISNYPDLHIKTQIFDEIFAKLQSKLQAGDIRHVEIKLEIFDWSKFKSNLKKSIFIIKLSLQSNLLFVQNLETYQQFCSFILLGYWDNLNWKCFVLQTYDYSIYLDWYNHFIGYKCSNNRHKTVHDLLETHVFRTCNKYQFDCWVNFANRFNIFDYPDFRFNKEIFQQKIKSAVIPFN